LFGTSPPTTPQLRTPSQCICSTAELLWDFPELGTPYRKRKNVRRLRCDPYFIYYRVHRENRLIEVMDFWHSARMEPNF
jgi:plasmid stabilization system protein ParE